MPSYPEDTKCMAQVDKLTDAKIRALKPRDRGYKASDALGLYVWVTPSGSKLFRIKYRFNRKENTYSIGAYPEVSLKDARIQTHKVRAILNDGFDPNFVKRSESHSNHYKLLNDVVDEWLELGKSRWTEGTLRRNKASLNHVLRKVGKRPIEEITQQELRKVLDLVQDSGRIDLAHRIASMLKSIFEHAIYLELIKNNPASYLSKFLKQHKVNHIAAATDKSSLSFVINSIFNSSASLTVKNALIFQSLTFVRTKELRYLQWEEVNWESHRLEIPAEKMKMSESFIVPLSTQAIALLNEQKSLRTSNDNSSYVFHGQGGPSRVLSENTLNKALRASGIPNSMHTSHGYRSVARTILDEDFEYRVDWIEQQLAHKVKDSNGRAYNRTQHLKGRAEMMQHWSNYIYSLLKAHGGSNG